MEKLLIIIIGIFIFISCQNKNDKSSDVHNAIRLAMTNTMLSSPLMVAYHKGFFKKHGLHIIINDSFRSGKACFQEMLKGRADISIVATTPMVLASFKRNDFFTFITYTTTYDGVKFITRKGSGIKNAIDFKGKKIAVVKGTISEYLLYSYLVFNKVGLNEVKMIHSNPMDMPMKLNSKSVDVLAIWEPYADKASKLLGSESYKIKNQKVYRMAINCAVMKKFAIEKPEVLVKFTASIKEAVDFMKENRILSQQFLSKELDMNITFLENIWKDYVFAVTLDQLLVLTMESEAQWSMYKGNIKKQTIPNYLNYIYVDALKKVKPGAVTLIHK